MDGALEYMTLLVTRAVNIGYVHTQRTDRLTDEFEHFFLARGYIFKLLIEYTEVMVAKLQQ